MKPSIALALALSALSAGCSSPPADVWDPDWKKVWADEFDDEIDASIWTREVGGHGFGNDQLEYDTDRDENAAVEDGQLVIRAIREQYEGNSWTSARLNSKDGFSHGYGRFEARIHFPAGQGLWPAFWLMGTNYDEVGWPTCGEIDIVELRGEEPDEVITTLHGPGYSGGGGVGTSTHWLDGPITDGFHVYAVEVDPEHVAWFVDDTLVHKVHPGDLPPQTGWVFDHELFILLNLAVGGHMVADPTGDTPSPSEMRVDWVRVWERKNP